MPLDETLLTHLPAALAVAMKEISSAVCSCSYRLAYFLAVAMHDAACPSCVRRDKFRTTV